jgi:DnaJ-class molecular chaperone
MKCKECKAEFQPWKRVVPCSWNCEDGTYESERDYATVFVTCPGCKGAGEQVLIEDEFCSDDCIEDHVYKIQDTQ